MTTSKTTSIVWFRQDLRLKDNLALAAAVNRGGPVIPVYIAAPEDGETIGTRSRWWIERSLRSLAKSLEKAGSRLIIRTGKAERMLTQLVKQTSATAVFVNRCYEPATTKADAGIMDLLAQNEIDVFVFDDSLLFDPRTILNRTGGPYRVFTAFWNRVLEMEDPGLPAMTPQRIPAPAQWPDSMVVGDAPNTGHTNAQELDTFWSPGEHGALEALERFARQGINDYGKRQDHPGEAGTSRLSPCLHFGEISPRRIWYDIRKSSAFGDDPHDNPYLRQLVWREFSYYLLHHFPDSVHTPLRGLFASFPWREDAIGLDAWKNGRTGYPLVDAGMRELDTIGWMHNRVRMVTASFLVKHLMIHWLEGAKWFMERLVDADLANNTMGWQWTAGCGADAAPYFRVFNPVLQGTRFDSGGRYVRKWIPELTNLPDRYIHSPWTAPKAVLKKAGLEIGREYPAPVVDHDFARARALEGYESLRKNQSRKTDH